VLPHPVNFARRKVEFSSIALRLLLTWLEESLRNGDEIEKALDQVEEAQRILESMAILLQEVL
jgi:DNA mismatch repair ATPase MutS